MKLQRLQALTLLAALFAALCFFEPQAAWAASEASTIAVAPFSSVQKTKKAKMQAQRARTAIVKALGKSGNVEFLSWATVTNRAKRQYIKGAALENPKRIGPVVKKLGGDVIVFGKINKMGKLTITITNTKGAKLWVKTVPLRKGNVSPALAKKFARAIEAAAKTATPEKKKPEPKVAPKPEPKSTSAWDQDTDSDWDNDSSSSNDSSSTEDEDAAPAPAPKKKPVRQEASEEEVDDWGRPKKKIDRDQEEDSWKSSRSSSRQRDDDDEDDSWNRGRSSSRDRRSDDDGDRWDNNRGRGAGDWEDYSSEDSDIGPSIVKLSADLSLTFRKYQFCNGVTKCGDVPVDGSGHSIDFSTSTPYLGFRLGLELFPAARVRTRYLRGLGIVGNLRMNPGISVSYVIGNSEETTELSGKEIDLNIAATYRFYYNAGFMKNAWVGLELGYMRYGFTIDENPLFSSSTHGGFAMGIDAGFPLHRYVAVDLNFTFQPSTAPKDDERAFFAKGEDTSLVSASGKGLKFDVGLEFPFSRYIGLDVKFDFARYWSDMKRPTADDVVIPAHVNEQYIGISVGMTGKF